MKLAKQALALLLASICTLALASCGTGNKGETGATTNSQVENLYNPQLNVIRNKLYTVEGKISKISDLNNIKGDAVYDVLEITLPNSEQTAYIIFEDVKADKEYKVGEDFRVEAVAVNAVGGLSSKGELLSTAPTFMVKKAASPAETTAESKTAESSEKK